MHIFMMLLQISLFAVCVLLCVERNLQERSLQELNLESGPTAEWHATNVST